jgi:monoamine oxidase
MFLQHDSFQLHNNITLSYSKEMKEYSFDIIIAGAGAAGLIAAMDLSANGKSVAIVEARDRVGGRMHTIFDDSFSSPIESGAEFIHGKLELTLSLLKEAGINHQRASGEFWEKR